MPKNSAAPARRLVVAVASIATVAAVSLGAAPAMAADAPWSPPVTVADGAYAIEATVVAPNGTITSVIDTPTGIASVTSTDGGATWGALVMLGSGGDYAYRPYVAVTSSGLLAATWVEYTNPITDIFVATSSDQGATWSTPISLPNVTDDVDDPVIASSSANGFTVVWKDNYFNKVASSSTDGGVTWSAPFVITEAFNSYGKASIVPTGPDELVVIFQEFDGLEADYSIQSRVSTDGGITWGPKVVVGPAWSGTLGNGLYAIGVSPAAGTVIAAWTRGVGDFASAVFAATSTDGGETWGAPIQVFGPAYVSEFAISAVGPTTAGIVWHYYDDTLGLSYATVDVGATAASTPVSIDTNPESVLYERLPSLSTLGNVRVVTWYENHDGPQSGMRAAASCDAGATWTPASNLALGEDVSDSDAQSLVSGGVFTAFWVSYDEQEDESVAFASSTDSPCLTTASLLADTGSETAPAAGLLALVMLALGAVLVVKRRRTTA